MPAAGGEATRLTFHSTDEIPSTLHGRRQGACCSRGYRQERATDAQFPVGIMTQLYSVAVTGGRVSQVLPTPALDATTDASGGQLILPRLKGYESDWRKHHTSSVTRDVWVYDLKTEKYTPADPVQRRGPESRVRRQRERLLLPERAERVVQRLQELAGQSVAIHRAHPLHEKSRPVPDALDDTARCASRTTARCTRSSPAVTPARSPIQIAEDGPQHDRDRIVPVNDGFTEATLSPNGKEFAYVFRGEIFVSSVDGGITKRVTNTPWQERSVQLQPGRPVAGLRGGAGQQLEHLHGVDRSQGGALLLRRHRAEDGDGGRHRRRGVPAGVLARREGSRVPREPRHAEGREPGQQAVANHPRRRPQLLLCRRRPVLPVVAGRQVVPRPVRPARAHLHAGDWPGLVGRQGRSPQPHPQRLRQRPAEVGHGREDG